MDVKTPPKEYIDQGKEILFQESRAVAQMAERLGDEFSKAIEMIYSCKGSIVLTGIGKAGLVGQKISATLASTGSPSQFLHAAEAIHGDLGRLREDDIALVLSHSGSSEEIVRLIGLLKQLDVTIIGMTGDKKSPLAKYSKVTLWLGDIEEVCPLGVAPSTSTTCMLALGDALALTVMKMRDFQAEDYARYHPGGALGRKLVTVEQAALFSRGKKLPLAPDDCTIGYALKKAEADSIMRHGCILLIDKNGVLSGLLTDGDIRRGIRENGVNLHEIPVAQIMTTHPKTVRPDTLASEAMAIFHKHRIDEIPVVDQDNRPVALIDVQDVVALKILQ
ncbi:MAG: KpsF/GutQ family sugar-phosphate isomerase [Phycisphaerae bacterium]|nr:KpsF/GutQ family sugar-phosphate isomerase [Phycisphaerae bacterium]